MNAYTEERAQRADEELRRQELAQKAQQDRIEAALEQYKAELASITKLLVAASQEQTKRQQEADSMKGELAELRMRLGDDDGK